MVTTAITDPAKLPAIAREIRKSVIASLAEAGSGHLGGSLGVADILTTLYFSVMRHDPRDPKWAGRDRFILSIGHVVPALYATLAHAGYFPLDELLTLRKLGSRLQGHPGRDHGLPGLELSAGSLGQGLSVAVGMALTAKMDHTPHRVFSLHGDGELQEGSIWESAMAAAHHKLNNLTAIIDRNGLQIDGETERVMRLEPLEEKWRSFGWEVFHCDGNSIPDLLDAFQRMQNVGDKPQVLIARTIMCKGAPSIENDYPWHGKVPTKEQAMALISDLK